VAQLPIKQIPSLGESKYCTNIAGPTPKMSQIVTVLTSKGPRVFQWKNGRNYPLLKNTLVIIFSTTSIAFDHKILKLTLAANIP
jgi:hypothetical protein